MGDDESTESTKLTSINQLAPAWNFWLKSVQISVTNFRIKQGTKLVEDAQIVRFLAPSSSSNLRYLQNIPPVYHFTFCL